MHVPIDLLLPRQLRVGTGEQARRDIGREDGVDEFVEAEGGEDFVRVQGEGAESEGGGEGLGCFGEEGGGWREGIAHSGSAGERISGFQVVKMRVFVDYGGL